MQLAGFLVNIAHFAAILQIIQISPYFFLLKQPIYSMSSQQRLSKTFTKQDYADFKSKAPEVTDSSSFLIWFNLFDSAKT